MGLKEIEKEIRESAQKEIDAISAETAGQLDELKKKIEEKAQSEMKKLQDKGINEQNLDRKRILAKAGLQIREQEERVKDEMIEKVFSGVSSRIIKMTDRQKGKILKMLAEEAKEGLEKPEVFVDRKYAKLLKGAKSADLGDFGVRVTSGHITVDNTLTAKLNEVKSNSRHKVAGKLWPS